jgi:hypothetical protein
MLIQAKWRWVLAGMLTLALVLTAAGTVAAQEEDDDDGGDEPLFEHPVVAVFRAYFGDEVADEVAAYHPVGGAGEAGSGGDGEGAVGFGVLVKMYSIAAESQEACAGVEGPCGVTVPELMEAYNSGVGMGQLYKLYGKPSMLGVGHLKKADESGPPEHAGPKEKDECKDKGGPPDHAGPKGGDKDKKKDK